MLCEIGLRDGDEWNSEACARNTYGDGVFLERNMGERLKEEVLEGIWKRGGVEAKGDGCERESVMHTSRYCRKRYICGETAA